jgi:hypothetical protein
MQTYHAAKAMWAKDNMTWHDSSETWDNSEGPVCVTKKAFNTTPEIVQELDRVTGLAAQAAKLMESVRTNANIVRILSTPLGQQVDIYERSRVEHFLKQISELPQKILSLRKTVLRQTTPSVNLINSQLQSLQNQLSLLQQQASSFQTRSSSTTFATSWTGHPIINRYKDDRGSTTFTYKLTPTALLVEQEGLHVGFDHEGTPIWVKSLYRTEISFDNIEAARVVEWNENAVEERTVGLVVKYKRPTATITFRDGDLSNGSPRLETSIALLATSDAAANEMLNFLMAKCECH